LFTTIIEKLKRSTRDINYRIHMMCFSYSAEERQSKGEENLFLFIEKLFSAAFGCVDASAVHVGKEVFGFEALGIESSPGLLSSKLRF
jgi:hypothetical protein